MAEYISLEKINAYKLARELSTTAWSIYQKLSWEDRRIFGMQFIEATDSTGANISEGYGRFHFLDRIKFYFNARGSLLESRHWFSLMDEREKIEQTEKEKYLKTYGKLRLALNGLIKSTREARSQIP